MTPELMKIIVSQAKYVQSEADKLWKPREEGTVPRGEMVLLRSITKDTKGYIEKIAHQINGTYENGWYDACAVLIRRLIETLIIEAFEHHGIADQVKDDNGAFVTLRDLIPKVIAETTKWNVSRETCRVLPGMKDIGDRSAHNRYFLAHRGDINKLIKGLRVVVQELIHIAELK